MQKVRIGIFGGNRGSSMVSFCKRSENAQVVALCDKSEDILQSLQTKFSGLGITFYRNFEDFIAHDMDAVVLANYATEHAPYAIAAMNRGLHVFSEVCPCQTMQEAVSLVETMERTGKIYAYGENYCYIPVAREMRSLYKEGYIGEFEYGEGEYIHNCEPIWPAITQADPSHWRNMIYSTFYCTHSLGPLLHITGLRPVSVIGFEGTQTERKLRVGAKGGAFGIEMVTLENGGIIKSIHGDLYKNSIWYSLYGSKGRMECAREDASHDNFYQLYLNYDAFSGDYSSPILESRKLTVDSKAAKFGHGGADYYAMHCFIDRLLGNENAEIVDLYEALDMFLPGMFAYRSILNNGCSMQIPDLRDPKQRDIWRNDTACTDPAVANDMLLPTSCNGTPEIDDGVYEYIESLSHLP